jgi:hypothetical protein
MHSHAADPGGQLAWSALAYHGFLSGEDRPVSAASRAQGVSTRDEFIATARSARAGGAGQSVPRGWAAVNGRRSRQSWRYLELRRSAYVQPDRESFHRQERCAHACSTAVGRGRGTPGRRAGPASAATTSSGRPNSSISNPRTISCCPFLDTTGNPATRPSGMPYEPVGDDASRGPGVLGGAGNRHGRDRWRRWPLMPPMTPGRIGA